MSREQWEAISADGAPPGVYVPNMSDADARTFRAKKIGGSDPRVEIRVTMGSQIKIVVRPKPISVPRKTHVYMDTNGYFVYLDVTISMNGPAEFTAGDWADFNEAIREAKEVLEAT